MELRWLVENSEEYPLDGPLSIGHKSDPILQYKVIENPLEAGLHKAIWSDWIDVPTVHVDI